MKIAYFIPLYPSITLTFIAREVHQLEKMDNEIWIFSSGRADSDLAHPEFAKIKAKIFYPQPLRLQLITVLWANVVVMLTHPKSYIKALRWTQNMSANRVERWRMMLDVGYFSYVIKKAHVERIHTHFALDWAAAAMLASWITHIPFSLTTHAADIYQNPEPHLLPELFSEVDFLVTISDYNRIFLLKSYGSSLSPERVFVVHCGIDLEVFPFLPLCREIPEVISIITIARLVEKKGHASLLQALQMLKQQGYKFTWTVIGRGPLLPKIQVLATEMGLSDEVTFLGAMTQDDVQLRLREADILVLPCVQASGGDMDGIPVVLMEAMAMGVPVLSTTVSGIPELITHNETGWLVAPNDAPGLAFALGQWRDGQPYSEKMLAKAREKVCADFNIQVEATRLLELFKDFTP